MPATTWTEMSVAAAGYMDSVPSLPPSIGGVRVTEDYFADFLMEYGLTVEMFFAPGVPGAWTKPAVTATSYTEGSVASTAWTEVTG